MEDAEGEVDLYCVCNEPDDGRVMVSCDDCGQWYHTDCVSVDPEVSSETYVMNSILINDTLRLKLETGRHQL